MRALLLLLSVLVSLLLLFRIPPLNSGVSLAGNEIRIPYSWDLTGPKNPLAVVSPPEPQWLRVASFNVYTGNGWVRKNPQGLGRFVGGSTYSVRVTPYAIMLYPAFPVPQPYPGTSPRVEGAKESGDTFTFNGFQTKVIVKYSPPFPYADYPQLSVPVREILGPKMKWSTPRVRALAEEILNKFKNSSLRALLSYLTTWLRSNYRYALKYSGTPAGDAVDWFLFQSKTGMCVHFASAAAVLLNDMGVRARVVYGFANSYVTNGVRVFVTPTHMWVEVWTPGGWVPWDPSPPQATSASQESVQRLPAPRTFQLPQAIAQKPKSVGVSNNFRISANIYAVILSLSIVALVLKALYPWLRAWPVAFRKCVEKSLNVKGLTLRELAKVTGIKELEKVQLKYLREGKWGSEGLIKAVLWCMRERLCTLFKQRSRACYSSRPSS